MTWVIHTWADVRVGMWVRDKTGGSWEVKRAERGWFRLAGHDGSERTAGPMVPDAQVDVWIVDPTLPQAVATVAGFLGGTLESQESLGRPMRVLPFPTTGSKSGNDIIARRHLWVVHGEYVDDVKTFAELLKCHDATHAEPSTSFRPHTHDLSPANL